MNENLKSAADKVNLNVPFHLSTSPKSWLHTESAADKSFKTDLLD